MNALKTVYIGRDLDYQDRSEGDYDYAPFHNGEFEIDVTIGPKVTEIPAYCFHDPYGSCGVKTVDFSNATSLTSIGKGAFYDNDLLTGTLVLSTPLLTTIGESAFYDCDKLKTVYLLSSHVSSFGSSCFEGQTIYVNSSSLCDSYKKQYADGKFEAIPESRMLRYQTTDEKKLELLNCMCSIYDDGEGIMDFKYVRFLQSQKIRCQCGRLRSSLGNKRTTCP